MPEPDLKPGRAWSCCLKITFGVSLVLNVSACVGFAFFFFWIRKIQKMDKPAHPQPKPDPVNSSCPFGNGPAPLALALTLRSTDTLGMCWPKIAHEARLAAPYVVLADDWWLNDTALSPVYAGANRSFQLQNLLPGVSYSLQVQAWPWRSKEPTSSHVFRFQTQERAFCGNAKDLVVYRDAQQLDMPSKVKSCMMKSGTHVDDSRDCIVKVFLHWNYRTPKSPRREVVRSSAGADP